MINPVMSILYPGSDLLNTERNWGFGDLISICDKKYREYFFILEANELTKATGFGIKRIQTSKWSDPGFNENVNSRELKPVKTEELMTAYATSPATKLHPNQI